MSKDLIIKIDLNAPVTFSGFAGMFRSFLVWWLQELKAFIPVDWRDSLQKSKALPRVIVYKDHWCLESTTGGCLTFLNTAIAYEVAEELSRNAPLSLARGVEVVLPNTDGLLKRIKIPATARSRMRQVIRLQLDRIFPLRGDDVLFDCYLADGKQITSPPSLPAIGEVLIETAMVPKRRILAVEHMLRETGLVPKTFLLAETPARFTPQGLPWTKQDQSRAIAMGVGLITFAGAVLLGPTMRDWDIADLTAEIDSVTPQVRRAIDERAKLERYQLPLQALSPDRVTALDLILDLTRRFPDNTNVQRLDVRGSQVWIKISSSSAQIAQSLLHKSPLLTQVKIMQGETAETFSATATLRSSARKRGD